MTTMENAVKYMKESGLCRKFKLQSGSMKYNILNITEHALSYSSDDRPQYSLRKDNYHLFTIVKVTRNGGGLVGWKNGYTLHVSNTPEIR